jgi:hypothetical protein
MNTLRSILRQAYPTAWLLEGKECMSQKELCIIFAGTQRQKNYFSYLAYGDFSSERALGRKWVWNILRPDAKKTAAAIVVIETALTWPWFFSQRPGFCIPTWINGRVDLKYGLEQALKTGNVKEDLRRIRKNKLQYEVRRDRKSFSDFYHGMYVPYMKRTHGNRALLHSYENLIEKIEQSELLLIRMGAEIVSGQVLVYQNGLVRTRELGIKDGDFRFVKAGAAAALYYFGLTYLKDRGFRTVELGGSRAFLNDGVLQFKKKWGVQLIRSQPRVFFLRPAQVTDGVKGFLSNNPFIYLGRKGLCGAIFPIEQDRAADGIFSRYQKKYSFEGLKKLNFFRLKDGPRGVEIITEDGDLVLQEAK